MTKKMAKEHIYMRMASKEVGTFENDKLNGYAIKYFADGSVNKEGIFKDDEFLYAQTKTLPSLSNIRIFS